MQQVHDPERAALVQSFVRSGILDTELQNASAITGLYGKHLDHGASPLATSTPARHPAPPLLPYGLPQSTNASPAPTPVMSSSSGSVVTTTHATYNPTYNKCLPKILSDMDCESKIKQVLRCIENILRESPLDASELYSLSNSASQSYTSADSPPPAPQPASSSGSTPPKKVTKKRSADESSSSSSSSSSNHPSKSPGNSSQKQKVPININIKKADTAPSSSSSSSSQAGSPPSAAATPPLSNSTSHTPNVTSPGSTPSINAYSSSSPSPHLAGVSSGAIAEPLPRTTRSLSFDPYVMHIPGMTPHVPLAQSSPLLHAVPAMQDPQQAAAYAQAMGVASYGAVPASPLGLNLGGMGMQRSLSFDPYSTMQQYQAFLQMLMMGMNPAAMPGMQQPMMLVPPQFPMVVGGAPVPASTNSMSTSANVVTDEFKDHQSHFASPAPPVVVVDGASYPVVAAAHSNTQHSQQPPSKSPTNRKLSAASPSLRVGKTPSQSPSLGSNGAHPPGYLAQFTMLQDGHEEDAWINMLNLESAQ